MGWIGSSQQLLHALAVVGADRDPQGAFLITGAPVTSFMGLGEEIVVPDETQYLVGGAPRSLVGLMTSTSYGLAIHVI